jgi:hypothetical protein
MYKVTVEDRLNFIERELKAIKDKLYNNKQPCLAKDVKDFFKSGWVYMKPNGTWVWCQDKPTKTEREWINYSPVYSLAPLNLARVECWADSLMEV